MIELMRGRPGTIKAYSQDYLNLRIIDGQRGSGDKRLQNSISREGDLCKIFLFFKILKFTFTKFIFLK